LYCPQKQILLSHLISQTLCRHLSSESQTWQHPADGMGKAAPAQCCLCNIYWTWRSSTSFTPASVPPSHLCQAPLCKGFRDHGSHHPSTPITCARVKRPPGAETPRAGSKPQDPNFPRASDQLKFPNCPTTRSAFRLLSTLYPVVTGFYPQFSSTAPFEERGLGLLRDTPVFMKTLVQC